MRRRSNMHRFFAPLFLVCAGLFLAPPASAVTIDTVPIGNVGNANDPATGGVYGGVGYAYNIGKYDVTVGQYTAFLNAVAATDTYALYNPAMATDLNIAGISQSGVSGSYSYSVIGSPNKPVTYVSWGDAARFSNWLHNGQPTGPQNAGTTEGGAYPLNGATTNAALNAISRNAGAQWFIPTENEWYKAAYHQPAGQGGDADNYWAYPTRTNSTPYSAQPPGSSAPTQSNTANYNNADDDTGNGYNDGFAVTGSIIYDPSQNYLTDVGAYTQSSSFYGTFDQAGNVYQWNEALISGSRGLRGGYWNNGSNALVSSFPSSGNNPTDESFGFGFRVASVPEPSALALLAVAAMAAGARPLHRKLATKRSQAGSSPSPFRPTARRSP